MSAEQELEKISGEMSRIFAAAVDQSVSVVHFHQQMRQLVLEADAIIKRHFGIHDTFSSGLINALFLRSRSDPLEYVETMADAQGVIRAAINHMRREPMLGRQASPPRKPPYVDASTIATLSAHKHPDFDFSRLVQMCRELNEANEHEALITVVILVRAIIDHVPPIFGETTFGAVANKMPKSIKASLLHLENSSRNIADSRLHQHIRRRETIPAPSEANFSQDLSVLLSEVISRAKGP